MEIQTFSIVAHCVDEGAWGVAVASKFPAVGAVVPWARAGAGAVATQSYAKMGFGPAGLELMGEGLSAETALSQLLAADAGRETRQVALVDAKGAAAAHTGADCHAWAGHLLGDGFSAQGNLLAGEAVIKAMAAGYQRARGELADRLVAALLAGEQAGGDRRGKQSAAVLVARPNGGYGGDNDRYLDLRVDDAAAPVADLMDLVKLHHLYFQPPKDEDKLLIDAALARELQAMMIGQGFLDGAPSGEWDETSAAAFGRLIGNENLEMRWRPEERGGSLDKPSLEYLRQRFG